ncbi:MAG: hypothetical protein O7H40_13915 [Gammaproteobacteria bacterium]|nr:hypothetical protein [Gammaproteobacteria bacterium]
MATETLIARLGRSFPVPDLGARLLSPLGSEWCAIGAFDPPPLGLARSAGMGFPGGGTAVRFL